MKNIFKTKKLLRHIINKYMLLHLPNTFIILPTERKEVPMMYVTVLEDIYEGATTRVKSV